MIGEDKDSLIQMIKPFPEDLLNYYTVGKLIGKDAIGNVPQAEQEVEYADLINILHQ
jgi:hypothetical protein